MTASPRVGGINQALQIAPPAESLVDPEVADRQVAPIDREPDVGDRHELEAGHPKVGQVVEAGDGTVDVAAELANHHLVDDQVLQGRRPPGRFLLTPLVVLITEGDRRELADPELTGERVDHPVDRAGPVRRVDDVAVDVAPWFTPGGSGLSVERGIELDAP